METTISARRDTYQEQLEDVERRGTNRLEQELSRWQQKLNLVCYFAVT